VFARLVLIGAGLCLAAPAIAGVPLANYRSVHDLTLAGAEIGEASVKGRLVTEFTGSECSGYTTRLRFVTRSADGEGEPRTDDSRSLMFESPDGFFEFTHETFVDEELIQRTVGSAVRAGGEVAVTLTEPEDKVWVIDSDVAFPTEQVVRALDAAIAGKNFVAFDLYDGTEGGEVIYGTSHVIGPVSVAENDLDGETAVADAGFAGQRHWPLTISYFQKGSDSQMTPDYTMSLIVYENGVSRDVKLDYGSFVLVGKLTQLEMFEIPSCPE
jgi:hypothetical protein